MKRSLTTRTTRRAGLPVTLLALAALALPGGARSQTACGALITNIAMATMWSGPPDLVAYEVSYGVTATVLVLCPPVIALRKSSSLNGSNLVTCAAGCTVTFSICLENQQFGPNDSVWSVTITDRLPTNMSFVSWGLDDYNTTTPAPAAPVATQSSVLTGGWSGTAPVGQTAPYYLRWVVDRIGPTRSACLTYRAKIL